MDSKEYNAQRRDTYKTLRELGDKRVMDIRLRLMAQCPPCFPDEDSWQRWREASKMTFIPLNEGWCTDCTQEYQAEMVLQERCFWPCTRFKVDSDGMTYGKRSSLDGLNVKVLQAIARGD